MIELHPGQVGLLVSSEGDAELQRPQLRRRPGRAAGLRDEGFLGGASGGDLLDLPGN